MKTINKKFAFIFGLIVVAVLAMGAGTEENIFRIGVPGTTSDIEIQMDQGRLIWDNTNNKLKFSNDSGASVKEIGSGGGAASGVNLIENADFETGSPPSNWSASGGTFIAETSNPGFDTQSGSWDASAASQTLDSDFKTVPLGLENRSCNATLQYKYATGSSGDYKLQVVANTAGLLAEVDLDVTTDWVKKALQFTCPSTDSIKLRVTSTLDAGVILTDNATLGKTDFVNISQTELVAHGFYATTANCDWTRASASLGDFTADTDCPSITVTSSSQAVNTSDNDLPDIAFDNLLPGTYLIQANFPLDHDTTADSQLVVRLTDGTTNGAFCGELSETANRQKNHTCFLAVTYSTAGARNFKLQASDNQTGSVRIPNSQGMGELSFTVYKFPSSSSEGLTLETTGWYIDANMGAGGVNSSLGTAAVSAYSDITNSSLVLTVNPGSQPVQIACQAGTAPEGTTCNTAAVPESTGIAFEAPWKGKYLACASFAAEMSVDASSRAFTTFQLVETGETTTAIIQEGKNRLTYENDSDAGGVSTESFPFTLCGIFDLDPGKRVLRVQFETAIVAGTISNNIMLTDEDATSGQRDINWRVIPLNQNFPTPVFTELQNLVKSPGTTNATFRAMSAKINCDATPLITEEIGGDWLASVAFQSTGECNLTLNAGICPNTVPHCAITPRWAATALICGEDSAETTTTTFYPVKCRDHANNLNNGDYAITCVCD